MLTKKTVLPNVLKTCLRLISSNAFEIACRTDFVPFFTIYEIYVSSKYRQKKYIFERMLYKYFDAFNYMLIDREEVKRRKRERERDREKLHCYICIISIVYVFMCNFLLKNDTRPYVSIFC